MQKLLLFLFLFVTFSVNAQLKDKLFNKEKDPNKDWSIFAFPLAFYQPETSVEFGVGGVYSFYHKTKDEQRKKSESFITPYFLYSIKKQMRTELTGQLFFDEDKYFLDFELSYYKYFYYYYGLGNESLKENEETYDSKRLNFRVDALYKFWEKNNKRMYAGMRYQVLNNNITSFDPEGLLASDNLVGLAGGFSQGAGVQFMYDSRDNVYFPWKGSYLKTSFTGFPGLRANDYKFSQVQVDYRSFMGIKNRVVLATQILVDLSLGNTPFYMMPSFGGKDNMRGYIDGRYRDRHSVQVQGEIRIPAFKRLIFAGFYGTGFVSDEVKKLFYVWKHNVAVGGGVRYKLFKDKNLSMRADIAFWQNTFGFYFVFNEAF